MKSAEQAAIFGVAAGIAYDPCYHADCETISNFDADTLDIMSDDVAHATLTFAETTRGQRRCEGQGDRPDRLGVQGQPRTALTLWCDSVETLALTRGSRQKRPRAA